MLEVRNEPECDPACRETPPVPAGEVDLFDNPQSAAINGVQRGLRFLGCYV
jgi:hypothetical protein